MKHLLHSSREQMNTTNETICGGTVHVLVNNQLLIYTMKKRDTLNNTRCATFKVPVRGGSIKWNATLIYICDLPTMT